MNLSIMRSAYIILIVACCFLPSIVLGNDLYSKMGVIESKAAVEAPSFNLESVEGEKVSLEEFKGKVVLLNFWATWCGPCREEMPALEQLEKKYSDKGFVIIAIAADKGSKAMHQVKTYCKMKDIKLKVLLDPDSVARKSYKVSALPTSFIIGRDGKISGKIFGAREWAEEDSFKLFEALIKE